MYLGIRGLSSMILSVTLRCNFADSETGTGKSSIISTESRVSVVEDVGIG